MFISGLGIVMSDTLIGGAGTVDEDWDLLVSFLCPVSGGSWPRTPAR